MKKTVALTLLSAVLSFMPLAVSQAEDGSSGDIGQKLNEILQNQKQIMDSLEQIKSELNVVKIRASNN